MSKVLIIAAIPEDGFWRCGRHFTKAGVVVKASDFDDKQWEVLRGEKMLRITVASKDDLAGLEDRADKIIEAINSLKEEDFQRDGKPRVDALNALIGDDLGSKVTAAERDDAWEIVSKDKGGEPNSPT